jgi:DNA-binding transcriptional MerR regulator
MLQVKVDFKVKGDGRMMPIGEVARSVGVRPSAIRYYESQGIVRPAARGLNGYRFYREDAVRLLAFVKRAQSLGLRLNEIKSLLQLNCDDRGRCGYVKQLGKDHLREIDESIAELRVLRRDLRALLRRKLRRPKDNEICPLIK